jgi:TRAP-type mannitol/chloroaromatic compound transport system permease small subunit
LNTLIPLFAFLMALQGLSQAIRAALLLATGPASLTQAADRSLRDIPRD